MTTVSKLSQVWLKQGELFLPWFLLGELDRSNVLHPLNYAPVPKSTEHLAPHLKGKKCFEKKTFNIKVAEFELRLLEGSVYL